MTQIPKAEPKYLVYLSQGGKVFPQLWYGDKTDGSGKSLLPQTLQYHLIPEDECGLSLDALIEKYSYKGNLT